MRKVGSRAMSGAAMSGPMVMPAFSATRVMLNASARRERGVRSVTIALLAVRYCAEAERRLEGEQGDHEPEPMSQRPGR